MQDLSNFRKSYEKFDLNESDVTDNPLELFRDWFNEAVDHDAVDEANAMSVSTIGLDGFPKTRVVLLKRYSENGFVFYTNYESEKGRAIEANPHVCLSFFWPGMERQVIIKGTASKLASNLSDGYFESRPKLSQVSAIISPQSQVVPSREYLESKQKELTEKSGDHLERPKYWGGYIVFPQSIEFWQGRPNRLHDRIRYELNDAYDWVINRLAP
ncbi:pyridoxamine 5'-phosphate oxidase [Flavobacteriaceae bacterium Ap0902]|nr:pyridoxamine 5'-phosphate oxidase [Flavobacteriaceae bacterium Ap0902]